MFLALCAFIGVLQLITLFAFGEESEWKLYPLSTHLPLALFLCIVYKKRLETVLATILTAYLFCQPVKWFGVLAYYLSHSETIEYIAIVYTDLWIDNNRVVAEFLPLMLVFIYMTVTILYSNEVEEKMYSEHKASIIRITSEQQKKEIEAIRRNEHDVEIDNLTIDVNMFSSILSNALDNALDAQKTLPEVNKYIRLMLKTSGGKILLSVKNPVSEPPYFVDGLPVSKREGHGYGTQSIRYMTERLNVKWQFSVKNNTFTLKVII